MDEVKKKVEAAEGQVKEQQKRLAELQSPPQADSSVSLPSDKTVDQLNSLLNQAIGAEREQLMQEENSIYFELSQKIDKEIERCGIVMVSTLCFASPPIQWTQRIERTFCANQ